MPYVKETEGKMSEAATPPVKKRRWRKPPSQVTTDNVNNELSSNNILGSQDQPSDFLYPEMLSDVDLVCRLNEYHVPVDSNCGRDELVELFSKHVMPKPQRKRRRQGQLQVNKSVMEDSLATAPCNNSSLATTHNNHDGSSSSATGSGDAARGSCDAAKVSSDTARGSCDTTRGSCDTARGSCDNKDRIIIKRKQNNDPSPPHRKKAFIRNDITWP